MGGQQGTGRLHVTPDRVSTVVSQEGHRTAVHGPPLGQTRVRRPCSPRGAEEAAQVPAPPRKTRPHRTARRVPSGRPRAQLPPCAAGAPCAHGEDSGHAHTQPLFHALEGNVCGGKVVFRVHGLHPLSERASGRRIRRRRPRAGPSGRPPGSAPCSRPAAPAAPQVPGDQAAAPPGGRPLPSAPDPPVARPHPPLSQVQTASCSTAFHVSAETKTPPPHGLCTCGPLLPPPFEKPGASQSAGVPSVRSVCLHGEAHPARGRRAQQEAGGTPGGLGLGKAPLFPGLRRGTARGGSVRP